MFDRFRSRLTSSHFHCSVSSNENTHSVIPNYWSDSLCPRFRGSTQLCRSSMQSRNISSHLVVTFLEPAPLIHMNSIWMSHDVRQRVDVLPLLLHVYFQDHPGSLNNSDVDTQSELRNYQSEFLTRSTLWICSPIDNIFLTIPWYKWTNSSD
jgi:hypothetical protein